MIRLRADVRMGGIQPETVLAMSLVERWCDKKGWDMWVFSICEGKHGGGSLHFVGHAFDWWPDTIAEDVFRFGEDMARSIRDLLGQDFDVVFERKPVHIHVEYQPKTGMNQ